VAALPQGGRNTRLMLRGLASMLALLLSAAAVATEITPASARAEFEAMHTEEAQRQFELLLARQPDDAAALYYRGRLQLRQHRRKQAVQDLRRAVELQPATTEYRLSLCEALGAYIDEQPFYRQLGLAREIHQQLESALAGDPHSIGVHDGLMKFYLAAPALIGGGRDKALHEAQQIAAINPALGHIAYGVIASHDQRYADAEREFRAAMQAAPADPAARYELGQAQLAQQHYDAALATYEEMLRQFPRETAAYYHLANAAWQSGQRLVAGIEALKIYLARGPVRDADPSLAQAYRLLGRLSESSLRRDDARSAYRTALQLDPGDVEVAQALRKLD
jgi:tetratricopeptide (TPR) repeat protein